MSRGPLPPALRQGQFRTLEAGFAVIGGLARL